MLDGEMFWSQEPEPPHTKSNPVGGSYQEMGIHLSLNLTLPIYGSSLSSCQFPPVNELNMGNENLMSVDILDYFVISLAFQRT